MGNYCTSDGHAPVRLSPQPTRVSQSFNSHCSPSVGSDWNLSHRSRQESDDLCTRHKHTKQNEQTNHNHHVPHHKHYYKHRIEDDEVNKNINNNNNDTNERQQTGLNSLVASSEWDINAFFPFSSNSSSSNSYDYLSESSCSTCEEEHHHQEPELHKRKEEKVQGKEKITSSLPKNVNNNNNITSSENHDREVASARRVIRISRSLIKYIEAWKLHIPSKLEPIPEPDIWSDGKKESKEWQKADALMSQEKFMTMNGNRWDAPHYVSALTLDTPQTSTLNFKTAHKPRCL